MVFKLGENFLCYAIEKETRKVKKGIFLSLSKFHLECKKHKGNGRYILNTFPHIAQGLFDAQSVPVQIQLVLKMPKTVPTSCK